MFAPRHTAHPQECPETESRGWEKRGTQGLSRGRSSCRGGGSTCPSTYGRGPGGRPAQPDVASRSRAVVCVLVLGLELGTGPGHQTHRGRRMLCVGVRGLGSCWHRVPSCSQPLPVLQAYWVGDSWRKDSEREQPQDRTLGVWDQPPTPPAARSMTASIQVLAPGAAWGKGQMN